MATQFESYIAVELPIRSPILTYDNTGYSGDPRLAVNQKINTAPKGTFYLNNADYTLWFKKIKTDPISWEQLLGVGGFSDVQRQNVLLTGDYNGINKDFYLPEYAIYGPPSKDVSVYHNGRRLLPLEYEVLESVPGNGYNLIRIVMFTPNESSKLYADYFVM